jgi:hypothetical protein
MLSAVIEQEGCNTLIRLDQGILFKHHSEPLSHLFSRERQSNDYHCACSNEIERTRTIQ